MNLLYALLAGLLAVPAVALGCRGCVWALGKLKALQRREAPREHRQCTCGNTRTVSVRTPGRDGPESRCAECFRHQRSGPFPDAKEIGHIDNDPCPHCGSHKVAPTVGELERARAHRKELRCLRCHKPRTDSPTVRLPSIATTVHSPNTS